MGGIARTVLIARSQATWADWEQIFWLLARFRDLTSPDETSIAPDLNWRKSFAGKDFNSISIDR
jgi:hypothetical protein